MKVLSEPKKYERVISKLDGFPLIYQFRILVLQRFIDGKWRTASQINAESAYKYDLDLDDIYKKLRSIEDLFGSEYIQNQKLVKSYIEKLRNNDK